MRIVVQKYGGSSVSTVERIKAVARKLVETQERGFSVVAVVSAMGDTTDELLSLARQVNPVPPRRELDMLLSVGERISMSLMSIAIQDLGHQAVSLTGSQCGIITTDSHANARIIDVRPFRIQDELERGRIVIVAGYQGTSYRREVTTLGRGGSDTTAVALAAALGAEACDIFSDVAGVFETDPRVVPSARRLDEISYEEMQELARQGARVLNAQAVEFARRRQIAIYARSTFGSDENTSIRRLDGFPDEQLRESRADGVRGIAGRKDVLLVSFEGSSSGEDRSDDVLEVLGDIDVLTIVRAPGSTRVDVVAHAENIPDLDAFAARLRSRFPETVSVLTGLGSVSAVGLGVGDKPRAFRRGMKAIQSAGVPVRFAWSAREAIAAVVPVGGVDDAVRALYAEFLGEAPAAP